MRRRLIMSEHRTLDTVQHWATRIVKNSAYLLAALPLGIIYFTIIITGLATGVGMIPIFWGVPVLVLTFAIGRWLAHLEREMASVLLDARFTPLARPAPEASWWDRLTWYATNRHTWLAMLFTLLKLPLGVIAFTSFITAVATPFALISIPLWDQFGTAEPFGWQINSLAEIIIAVPLGILAIPIGTLMILGTGWLMRKITEALLGGILVTPPPADHQSEQPAYLALGSGTEIGV